MLAKKAFQTQDKSKEALKRIQKTVGETLEVAQGVNEQLVKQTD